MGNDSTGLLACAATVFLAAASSCPGDRHRVINNWLQAKAQLQQTISRLTDECWGKCMGNPGVWRCSWLCCAVLCRVSGGSTVSRSLLQLKLHNCEYAS